MISLLSPAKTLNFEPTHLVNNLTTPANLDLSEQILSKLAKLSRKKIGELMNINTQLAQLNHERYATWTSNFNEGELKAAVLAFNGEVYRGLSAQNFGSDDFDFAQKHLRILSGLHGVLKPLDKIKPYRLEMGTRLSIGRKKNLYAFWQEPLAKQLREALNQSESNTILNLASTEYFKAVDNDILKANVVTCHFQDFKSGGYKTVMTYAKLARGAMANFQILHRCKEPEAIKEFNWEGYSFNPELTEGNNWFFTRKQQA
ncbi:MAG: peroxide stress protein YaaA [Bacteroidetes bacterium]|nr:peroxide stress protein YaaA [Bacteroidota bacterium]